MKCQQCTDVTRSGRTRRARRSECSQKRGGTEWHWNISGTCQCYICVSSQLISFIDVTSWQWRGQEKDWATLHRQSLVQLHENMHTLLVGASHPQAAPRAPSCQPGFSKTISVSFYWCLDTLTCVSSLFFLCPIEESCVGISCRGFW